MPRLRAVYTVALLATASPAVAQMAAPLQKAATTISEADVRRRIEVIAHDSMLGRDTPSPGLEMTAQYVADQFKAFGLKPGGDNGSWFQRYEVSRRKIDPAASTVTFAAGAERAAVSLTRDARFAFGGPPPRGTAAPAVVIGGALDQAAVAEAPLAGKMVLLVLDYSKPLTPAAQQVLVRMFGAGARGIVILSNRDSATFAQRISTQAVERQAVGDQSKAVAVVEVHERALAAVLRAAGVDPAQVRGSSSMVVTELPKLTIQMDLTDQVLESAFAPNTVGILEGSDPALKDEYVVYSAHMDHVGTAGKGACTRQGADSICNGADDDGSGTVGVVELAEAFSQPGARPKRSVIFLTVSGEEHGLWGSAHFAEHASVPTSQMVANINMDMIGRNWKDTIVAIGREHSDLGTTLERVNRAHPELRMVAIDDRWPEENFYFRSDHFNFARKGVPILFFFNGVHDDYHRPSDEPAKIDAEKEARIVQLLFYLGQEIANTPARPQWNPESYARIVEGKE